MVGFISGILNLVIGLIILSVGYVKDLAFLVVIGYVVLVLGVIGTLVTLFCKRFASEKT
ncbi:MAG: hypothetical protein LBG88_03240 [Christensenellaceae bacterium]|nr:hypothetical protein [Christensenellaceae bacterium]